MRKYRFTKQNFLKKFSLCRFRFVRALLFCFPSLKVKVILRIVEFY